MRRHSTILIIITIGALFVVLYLFVPWWLAILIGLFILGIPPYVERIFKNKSSRKLYILLFLLFVVFNVGNIIRTMNSETQTGRLRDDLDREKRNNKEKIANLIDKESDLRQKLKQAEDTATTAKGQVADFTEYGEVASYNFDGYQKSGQFAFPSTPVSKWTEGYLTVRDRFYYFDCSQNSINHYESMIKKCPKFPFPYLALSQCLLNSKNPSWKEYAIKAQSILKKTTKIPLHSKDHDAWLMQVNKLLDPAQIDSVLSPEVKQESNK